MHSYYRDIFVEGERITLTSDLPITDHQAQTYEMYARILAYLEGERSWRGESAPQTLDAEIERVKQKLNEICQRVNPSVAETQLPTMIARQAIRALFETSVQDALTEINLKRRFEGTYTEEQIYPVFIDDIYKDEVDGLKGLTSALENPLYVDVEEFGQGVEHLRRMLNLPHSTVKAVLLMMDIERALKEDGYVVIGKHP